MLRKAFTTVAALLASSIVAIVIWLMYIKPGMHPVRIDEPYSLGLKSNIFFERSLLTQKNNFSGSVKIIKEQEKTIIRLENIKQDLHVPACRDVRVLLSLDYDPKNSYNLGKLKGTEGNMNYILPTSEDISNYNSIMIWCESFGTDYAHVEIIPPAEKYLYKK